MIYLKKIRKAVIPAAGLGIRFLPATKSQPKEMLPIVDKPAIQYTIEELIKSGITDIIIVTGRNKRAVEDHFDYSVELETILEQKGKFDELKMIREISEYANIYYIRQKEPLGLGHAILKTKEHIGNEPFAVVLGDDIIASEEPVIKQMIDVREKNGGGSIIGVQSIERENVSSYGIIKPGEKLSDKVCSISDFVEKPSIEKAPSNLACLGRYILEPDIFEYLSDTKPGKDGEIQLTDGILAMINNNKKVLAYNFDGIRYDIGDKFGYIQANIDYALRNESLRGELTAYIKKISTIL